MITSSNGSVLRVTALCVGNSPVAGKFPAQRPMTRSFDVYSDVDQRKHQSSASLAFIQGIHRWPVNSPHKGSVTRKMLPFDDVFMSPIRLNEIIWIKASSLWNGSLGTNFSEIRIETQRVSLRKFEDVVGYMSAITWRHQCDEYWNKSPTTKLTFCAYALGLIMI